MRLLYTFSIFLYHTGIQIASLFHPKAKDAIKGRKNLLPLLEEKFTEKKKTIWIHCASLGEFEQARPLLEQIKKQQPNKRVLLTFFSPSGYKIQKNYNGVDIVSYLPFDYPKTARKFLEVVQPDYAIFIKYEFWFNFLNSLKKKNIPTYLASGIFWPQQHFFKFYGRWFAKQLSAFNHFFVQNKTSKLLLQGIGYQNISISGDSRFDRVIELSKEPIKDKRLSTFSPKNTAIIFGSSWEKEDELAKIASKNFHSEKIIIAPHEISPEKMQQLKASFQNAILWSETSNTDDLSSFQVLIIDKIGLLSKVYRYGKVALIGGGFGAGIHNALEAAVYGCPLLFGPNYQRFQEALDLIQIGAAKVIHNESDFLQMLKTYLENNTQRMEASDKAKKYVVKNAGATALIYNRIFHKI